MKNALIAMWLLFSIGFLYINRSEALPVQRGSPQPLQIRGQSTVDGIQQPPIHGSLNDLHVYRSPVTGYWYLRVEYDNGITDEQHFDQIHALLGLKLEK